MSKIVEHKEELVENFLVPYVDAPLAHQLLTRESMYELCAQFGFQYPASHVCTVNDYEDYDMPFDYPVVIKPMNMTKYATCIFPGKKKYILHMIRTKRIVYYVLSIKNQLIVMI